MALFGKKNSAAEAAPSPSATTDPSGNPSGETAAAPSGRAKAPKAPKEKPDKPARGRLKNGTMIGLNIGNSFIKAVEVSVKNGEITVSKMAMVPTPSEAYQNGNILSKTSLSNAIKALWKQGGFKGRAVVTSVAGTGALVVRVIEVPAMSDTQLADTMRLEAERYIPFPPTEVQMDFKALRDLPSDPDGGTMEVLLAAAQSEVIDLHVKVIQASRLEPKAIDVEPIALARSLSADKQSDSGISMVDYNQITALVNVGALSTEISLLRGDVLVFTRTVSNGGGTLTQAVADTLGLGIQDAERLKVERGDAMPPAGYDTGAGDHFGMDDFGTGGDAFGDLDLHGGEGDQSFDLSAPAAGDASADPFDLDFFNQGPKQSDAGAGHAQKEGQNFSFNFDDIVSPESPQSLPAAGTPAQPPKEAEPEAAPPASGAPQFNFSFDDNALPQSPSAPNAAPNAPAAPQSAAPAPALPTSIGDDLDATLLPAVAEDAPPIKTSSDDGFFSMPSAFDFSDFDLPASAGTTPPPTATAATTPEPVTPVAEVAPVVPVVPVTPAPTSGFSFGFHDDAASAASTPEPEATDEIENIADVPAALDADSFFALPEDTPSTPAVTPAVPTSEAASTAATQPTADALDLDSIFGAGEIITGAHEDAAEAGQPVASSAPEDDVLGLGGLGLGNMSTANDGGLNIGAIGNEDFSTFGAGLGDSVIADTDAITLYGAIEPALAELANEISRSLSFYLERVPDVELKQIFITGGGSRLRNFDQYLTHALGYESVVFNPVSHVRMGAPTATPEFVAAVGPMYSVAFGLALRDFVD